MLIISFHRTTFNASRHHVSEDWLQPMEIHDCKKAFCEFPKALKTLKHTKILSQASQTTQNLSLLITYLLCVAQFMVTQYSAHGNLLQFGRTATHWDILPVPGVCWLIAAACLQSISKDASNGRRSLMQLEFLYDMQYSSVTNLGMSYCKSYMIKDTAWCYSWFHLPHGMLLFCITLGRALKVKERNTLEAYRKMRVNCIVLHYISKVWNWNGDETK